ncbi:RTA1 like protein-domain-containing protein [Tuber borchii]|uniref:RTA1 like protein-domain-containing protein n=1 Tax=Tuber borchii TaxID=42251 RepID=A0A2T6ZJ09_TUBBO|nr:RTA1 like protein-domain-containing protein [Tuber borchii]
MASDKNDGNGDDEIWLYDPSKAAAILFAILYGITTLFHIIQMFLMRKWYCWALIMGGIWETVGYALRILSVENPHSDGYYSPMLTLIILAPAWIAAFDYMTLGRLINTFLPSKSALGLPARRITLIFVLFDIFSFVVQGSGSGFLSSSSGNSFQIGSYILISGLALQVAAFAFFTITAIRFDIKYKREFGLDGRERYVALLYCLYVSCLCILIRSLFRIAEFAEHYPGTLSKHEVYFYVLEAVPMLPTLVIFNFWHPGTVLVGEGSSFREEKRNNTVAAADDADI